jgi:hypothetical protein
VTEAEWLTVMDPTAMLRHLGGVNARKLRLFAASCCRRVDQLVVSRRDGLEDAVTYIDGLEREADGTADAGAWEELVRRVLVARHDIIDRTMDEVEVAFCTFLTAIDNDPQPAALWASVNANIALSQFPRRPEADEVAGTAEAVVQAAFLRDIFGDPFRPVAFDASWRTDTALSLARVMYESRDFAAMPILADALQDAGCENADVLDHCRGNGVHVRGCWVVDLVLGKS